MKEHNLPDELSAALSSAHALATEYDKVHDVLTGTCRKIPQLLSDRLLNRSESGFDGLERGDRGDLTADTQARLRGIDEALQSQIDVRSAAIESLSLMKVDLMRGHDALKRASASTLDEMKQKLRAEYDAAVAKLQSFWTHGDALERLIGEKVDLPIPARISPQKIEQASGQIYWGHEPVFIQRINGKSVTVNLDPVVVRIANLLSRLDRAATFGVGVLTVQQREGTYASRGQVDGGVHQNVYILTRPQRCYISGFEFPAGSLINTALFQPAHLSRLAHAKVCRPATVADVLSQYASDLPEMAVRV